MKKQMLSSIAKKFFAGNLMAAMMFLSANAAVSPVHFNAEPAKNRAAITFKGTDNDFMAFQVVYNNPEGNAFNLMITDELGNVVYFSTFQDEVFSKTFKVSKDEINKLNFTIRDAKSGETEKFKVNLNVGVTENIDVIRKK